MPNRISQNVIESLSDGTPTARISQSSTEALTDGTPTARTSQLVIEVLGLTGQAADSILTITQDAQFELLTSRPAISTIVFTQEATTLNVIARSVTQTLIFTQEGANVELAEADNTIVFIGTADVVKQKNASASSILVFSQTATCTIIYNRSITSTLVLNQIAARTLSKLISAQSTFVPVGTATANVSRFAFNTLVFNQTATAFVSKSAVNALVLTQTIDRTTVINRSLFSNFIPFQTVILGPNTIRRTISDTLTFTQFAEGFAVKGATNIIVFTQSAEGIVTRSAENMFIPVQTINVNLIYNRPINHIFNLSQLATRQLAKMTPGVNILAFTQSAIGRRILSRSASNNIVFSQEAYRERFPQLTSQMVLFDQMAEVNKLASRSVVQQLTFTQTVGLTTVINRTVNQVLSLVHGHYRYIGLGGINEVFIPGAQGQIVRSLIVLYGDDRSITLPAPEFDDSDSYSGRINIIRFTGGDKRIYKKESNKYKLNYDLIVDYHKIRELRLFIAAYNSRPFRLENHKGETWLVIFSNNPFDDTEAAFWDSECGNKFTISLEFEGVRLT